MGSRAREVLVAAVPTGSRACQPRVCVQFARWDTCFQAGGPPGPLRGWPPLHLHSWETCLERPGGFLQLVGA